MERGPAWRSPGRRSDSIPANHRHGSFDPDLLYKVFDAVSDEARAKFHDFQRKGRYGKYQCLTFWTPNVNIFRDPRWGRGQETYGEDPYLTSVLGLQVIRGLQGPADTQYDKLHACAKHFAVHSGPEWNRHSFNAENIDLRDQDSSYRRRCKRSHVRL